MNDLSVRRQAWGLSQGVMVLAGAGGFWLLFGIFKGTQAVSYGLAAIVPVALVVSIVILALVNGAVRLRRLSAFNVSLLRNSPEHDQARHELHQFAVVNLVQWVLLAGIAGWAAN